MVLIVIPPNIIATGAVIVIVLVRGKALFVFCYCNVVYHVIYGDCQLSVIIRVGVLVLFPDVVFQFFLFVLLLSSREASSRSCS